MDSHKYNLLKGIIIMSNIEELKKVLTSFEVVFKIIKDSTYTPDSFTSISHTLATLATIAKNLENEIKQLEEDNGN